VTVNAAAVDAAAAVLGPRAQRNVPVGPLTTYRVGGAAALFFCVESLDDLRLVGAAVAASAVPTVVLGRGSNTLVADGGYNGLVVVLGDFATTVEITGTTVVAGGGVLLPVLARRTAAAGLTGCEWMVGIPG
jgi:UDP-N-acetylmuramate dehydrogenase